MCKFPENLRLNRDVVETILTNVIGCCVSTSIRKSVSIYLSWKPAKNTDLNFNQNQTILNPVTVLGENSLNQNGSSSDMSSETKVENQINRYFEHQNGN